MVGGGEATLEVAVGVAVARLVDQRARHRHLDEAEVRVLDLRELAARDGIGDVGVGPDRGSLGE
jgi:hypothetical protein